MAAAITLLTDRELAHVTLYPPKIPKDSSNDTTHEMCQ